MNKLMIALALATMLSLGACESEKVEVQKSPCVGLEGSPCGPKRPVNGYYNREATRDARLPDELHA